MKKKQSLICAALSIASILSMGVPALAAEPADVPDVPVAETRLTEEATSMKVGDVFDLGDGYTAVVSSVKNEISPSSNARSYDTYNNDFSYDLALNHGGHDMGEVNVSGILTYCPSDGWAQYDSSDCEPQLNSTRYTSITQIEKKIDGNGTSLVTTRLRGAIDGAGFSKFYVLVNGYSNGRVDVSVLK